jgi:hypothetical protein
VKHYIYVNVVSSTQVYSNRLDNVPPRYLGTSRGGVKNSHILIQHSAEFGVRFLLSKIPRNAPS